MEQRRLFILLLHLLLFIILSCELYNCYTINDTYNLLNDKLANYNRKIRPTLNQSAPTEGKFHFQLISINDFNEVQEKLSVVAVIELNWVDEIFQWDPVNYGYLYTILVESESFWKPNFLLTNTLAKLDQIGEDWDSIRYLYNGTAFYAPLSFFSSSCSADITLFPWDTHHCILSFTPQGHFIEEMVIQTKSNKVSKDYYSENGVWTLLDSKVESSYKGYYMKVDVELLFERQPRFAVVNVVLPIVFMAFLSNVVFMIPTDSGERISYSITMLLAMAVFLTLVGDNLPKTSSPMSYLSYYLLSLLSISICVTLATIFNLRLHHNDASVSVSGFWEKIASIINCRKEVKRNEEATRDTGPHIPPPTINLPRQLRVHPQTTTVVEKPGEEKLSLSNESVQESNLQWKDISAALDKVFLVFFNVLCAIVTLVFFLLVFTGKRTSIENK